MSIDDTLRYTKIPLTHGLGAMPAVGFGTLIPDPVVTRQESTMGVVVSVNVGLPRDVACPVHWSCRSGICHNCETGLIDGDAAYTPEPMDAPADGNTLICCARPISAIELDL
jgi:hypothetical protein